MPDRLTPEQRHLCMSHNKSRDTKPELLVRKWLWRNGYRYRLNVNGVPGKPDIVMRRYRTAIFVNGCFWHGHEGCKYFVWPKSNAEFWRQKIETNISRDQRKEAQLRDMGWNVMIVWECELRPPKRQATLEWLESQLRQILEKR